MTITLTPELQSLVDRKVRLGRYNSAGEVVRESLHLLDEQDRVREIRREEILKQVMIGVTEIDAGQYITVESDEDLKKLADQVKEGGRKLLEERRKGQLKNGSI